MAMAMQVSTLVVPFYPNAKAAARETPKFGTLKNKLVIRKLDRESDDGVGYAWPDEGVGVFACIHN